MQKNLDENSFTQVSNCFTKKSANQPITAGNLKQQGSLENLIHHDEWYKFLRALSGSLPNFEKAEKDLFSMIRELGPALFCSFSSAETKRNEIIYLEY